MKKVIEDFRNVLFLFTFAMIYSCIFEGKFNLDHAISIILVINFSIYICGTIISYKFNLNYIDSFHKNFTLALLGIGIVLYAYIYTMRLGIDNLSYIGKVTRMNTIFSLYESTLLILAVKYHDVDINFKKIIIGVISASLLVSYLCTSCEMPFFLEIEDNNSLVSHVIRYIAIGSKFYLLKQLYNIRASISKTLYHYFLTYCIIRIFVQGASFIPSIEYINPLVIFILVIEYMANYCLLKIMVCDVIKNPYFNLYTNLMKKSETLEDTSRQLSEVCEEKKVLSSNYEKAIKDEEIKNELLTNISHEFKTPINVIYSAVQMQDVLKNKGDEKEILKYNPIIKQNCNRLIRLINNFIDITRLRRSNNNYNFKIYNLVALTEGIVMSVIPFAKRKNLNITFDTADEELFGKVEEQLFDRLILNLLSNAIKYSKEKGNIYVNLNTFRDNIEISIIDQGIGISEDNYKLIFNRFERIDQTFSRNTEGSGLGLNIVMEIVHIFKGDINIESKLGQGTTVTIILPLIMDLDDAEKEFLLENDNFKIDHEHEAEIELSDIYI